MLSVMLLSSSFTSEAAKADTGWYHSSGGYTIYVRNSAHTILYGTAYMRIKSKVGYNTFTPKRKCGYSVYVGKSAAESNATIAAMTVTAATATYSKITGSAYGRVIVTQ